MRLALASTCHASSTKATKNGDAMILARQVLHWCLCRLLAHVHSWKALFDGVASRINNKPALTLWGGSLGGHQARLFLQPRVAVPTDRQYHDFSLSDSTYSAATGLAQHRASQNPSERPSIRRYTEDVMSPEPGLRLLGAC